MSGTTGIYCVEGDDSFGGVVLSGGGRSLELGRLFRAVRLVDNWVPPALELEDGRSAAADLTMMYHRAFVAKDAARSVLERRLSDAAEFLPTVGPDGLWVVNVIRVIDALDEHRSDGRRTPQGGLWHVSRYVLRAIDYQHELLFKVKGAERDYVFATQAFVDILAAHRLRGLRFRPVEVAP